MRPGLSISVAAALLASGAAATWAGTPAATIAVSPATPGARATVKLRVRHVFQCGQPRSATVSLTFPSAEHVPQSIPEAAVSLKAGRVKGVDVAGETVSVSVAPALTNGVTCMSIVVGTLALTLDKEARLRNPNHAGTFAVAVQDGRSHYTARFRVSS